MKNTYRKSQVTIFVIIAIVIVAIIAGYYALSEKSKKSTNIPLTIQPVYNYVISCIQQSGVYAINKVGFYGGYNSFYGGILNINSTIPYWAINNRSYIPTETRVNSELSRAFLEVFPICINDFKALQEFKITASQVSVESNFSDQEVTFNLKYPLKIVRTSDTFNLVNFNEKIDSPFGAMYNSAKKITQNSTGIGGLCFTCASQSLMEKELYGQIFHYSNSSFIIVITPKDTQIKNATMQFNIALGY